MLCLYWHEPASNCVKLAAGGAILLAPFASLPLRTAAPTAPVAVHYRSHPLRFADGNTFAALELALERPPAEPATALSDAVSLAVRWRGPAAARMPTALRLAPGGVYTRGHRYALPPGPWCYLTGNLPHLSADLVEVTERICR